MMSGVKAAANPTWERRLRILARVVGVLVLVAATGACTRIPGRRASLDAISFRGNTAVDDDEIQEKMASQPTPKFLGFFRGVVYDYQVFDRYVLERDLQRIERYYRARGFYRAQARAGRVYGEGQHRKVEIYVEEGPPTVVGRVDVNGLAGIPPEVARKAKRMAQRQLRIGSRFEEDKFAQAEDRLLNVLQDNGYAYAKVARSANVDVPHNVVSIGFWVNPGKLAHFGEVTIVGLGKIPEAPVRRAVNLTPGDAYSRSELDAAQRALLDLGVFSAVNVAPAITPEQQEAQPDRVPIKVEVEVTKLKAVYFGGGVQADALKTEVHVTAGWEHRNLFGGLRSFRADLTPGLVLYPTRIPGFEKPEHLLPQVKLRTEFRQPGFLEPRTAAVVRAQGSIYPLLLSTNPDPSDPVLGYRDLRVSFGLERSMWKLFGAVSHNLQLTSPFTYLGPLDKDLGTVLVSYPEILLQLALTDRKISPREGVAVSLDMQAAGVGGDARDVKIQPDVRAYIPITRRVRLAFRASLGFLFPGNYGGTIESDALTGSPGNASRAEWVRDVQLVFLRGFFSGGAGSNRGYAPREVGPHGIIPFFNPGLTTAQLGGACTSTAGAPSQSCDLPLGGFTLWESSIELRYPIAGPLTGALFLDGSDVSAKRVNIRLNRPHLSVGAGARYDTPIGPIRLDVGYRIPGAQAPQDAADEGDPNQIFGLPIAISFGIGEAF
jgi:outer membrane protein insertion porin family/translocation and assembly module TamA